MIDSEMTRRGDDDAFLRQFGRRLELARTQLGMTQDQFGKAIGLRQMRVSRWERGTAMPDDPRALVRVAELSGLSLAWLILGDDGIDPGLAQWLASPERADVTEVERAWLRGVPVTGTRGPTFWSACLAALRLGTGLTAAEAGLAAGEQSRAQARARRPR